MSKNRNNHQKPIPKGPKGYDPTVGSATSTPNTPRDTIPEPSVELGYTPPNGHSSRISAARWDTFIEALKKLHLISELAPEVLDTKMTEVLDSTPESVLKDHFIFLRYYTSQKTIKDDLERFLSSIGRYTHPFMKLYDSTREFRRLLDDMRWDDREAFFAREGQPNSVKDVQKDRAQHRAAEEQDRKTRSAQDSECDKTPIPRTVSILSPTVLAEGLLLLLA